MKSMIFAAAILCVSNMQAHAEEWVQYTVSPDKTITDYLKDGYELKTAVYKGKTNAYDLFLQKGPKLVMCRDSGSFTSDASFDIVNLCMEVVTPKVKGK